MNREKKFKVVKLNTHKQSTKFNREEKKNEVLLIKDILKEIIPEEYELESPLKPKQQNIIKSNNKRYLTIDSPKEYVSNNHISEESTQYNIKQSNQPISSRHISDRTKKMSIKKQLKPTSIDKYRQNGSKHYSFHPKSLSISPDTTNESKQYTEPNIFELSTNLPSTSVLQERDSTDFNSKQKSSIFYGYAQKFKKERMRFLKKRFRLCAFAIIFVKKLKKFTFKKAIGRKNSMQEKSMDLVNFMQDLIDLYNIKLEQPFKLYLKLIKKFTENQQLQYKQLAVQLLEMIAKNLSKIPKNVINQQLIEFLRLIALDKGYIPSGFMFQFEIKRLDLSQYFACLKNMTPMHSKMIITMFFIIKILCGKILFRPWEGIDQQSVSQSDYPRYRQIVKDIASIFYFIIIKHFEDELQLIKRPRVNLITHFLNIKPLQKLSIYPSSFNKKFDSGTSRDFFPELTSIFYESVNEHYQQRIQQIKQNIFIFIDKIYQRMLASA